MAVAVVAGVALTAGCSKRDEVQEQRRDLAEAQREVQKETGDDLVARDVVIVTPLKK